MTDLDKLRQARAHLAASIVVTDEARLELYRRVRAAVDAGHGPLTVADAAGWSTKKAVYDALAKLRKIGDDRD